MSKIEFTGHSRVSSVLRLTPVSKVELTGLWSLKSKQCFEAYPSGLWSLKSKQCFEAYPSVKDRADGFVVTQE